MKTTNTRALSQTGFSLIELMVGMTIGLIMTLIITQAASVFSGQKQTTTGTADAQTNGSIALFSLAREMQMAGYGLMPSGDNNSPLECTNVIPGAEAIASAGMTLAAGIQNLSPVTIVNGAVSDAITIRYGDSVLGGIPTTLVSAAVGQALTVNSNLGCKDDDFVVVTNGTTCAVSRLANSGAITGTQIVNLKATEAVPAQVVANDSNISCLGNWVNSQYSINNGTLQRNSVDQVSEIVNLQAQYGISATANSNVVAAWVNADNSTGTDWANPSAANRNRIKAVRVAVVARNSKLSPTVVTSACSSTSAANPTGLCAWTGTGASPAPAIDLSADANWANYRYRVFETVIPLRNIIWSKATL